MAVAKPLPNGTPAAPEGSKITVRPWHLNKPKRRNVGGKTRRPSPYDEIVSRAMASGGEMYLIATDAVGDARKAVVKELRRATNHVTMGLDIWTVDEEDTHPQGIVFQVRAKRVSESNKSDESVIVES